MTTEIDSPARNQSEEEAKLVICSEHPQSAVEQLTALSSIAGYRLIPQNAETIHDIYFDTPDAQLRRQAVALRLRATGTAGGADTFRLALKGPAQATDWGGVSRLEIEFDWSEDTLERITTELAERGISLQQIKSFEQDRPLNVLVDLGLIVIQERSTHRQLRNVVAASDDKQPIAEMAIDSVTFTLKGQVIHHHELEIEAKQQNVSKSLQSILNALMARYASVLRPWRYGKLLTGKTLEKLSELGSLPKLLEGGHLSPAAYTKIEEYLATDDA